MKKKTINQRVCFRVVDVNAEAHATLAYTTKDQLHVSVIFDVGSTWTLSRDVLRNGLTGRAGIGDYTCWTDINDEYHLHIIGEDNGSLEAVTLHTPADAIRGFLIDTEDLVPYGSEWLDIDAGLAALLRGAR